MGVRNADFQIKIGRKELIKELPEKERWKMLCIAYICFKKLRQVKKIYLKVKYFHMKK